MEPDDDFDDVAVLTRILHTIPGGRRKYGYKAMAEKLLDMLDAEDVVLVRRSDLKQRRQA